MLERRFAFVPSQTQLFPAGRPNFLKALALGGFFYSTKGTFADVLTLSPDMTIGPYYSNKLFLNLDNDLLIVDDAITPGFGDIS